MAVYSFGEDSPMKFDISDKMARYYNEAAEQFFKAQTRFTQKFGRKWDPVADPIAIKWSKKQRKAWNDFSKVFNDVVKTDGPFHVNDLMEDYLVKNTVAVVTSNASSRWGKVAYTAAVCGSLYVLLRGLQA